MADGTRITLLQTCEYGAPGKVLVVSTSVANGLIAKGIASLNANQVISNAANVDSNFKTVQSAVLAKAGITEISPGVASSAAASIKPVSIRMRNSGAVVSVHHSIAIRRILDNLADLV